ncbi:hypothetical protein D6D19_09669 [Aureobasidium pullulans]|uniref:HNH nuclease domain-containing protein n=1 Tax=Aureobasidium pullulans TaxID=5580 RepID=A0A4S8ZBY4_AURPU|nr:hypothetical protein D6D19_09669 [Aureobasidium pullulans]
MARDGGRDIPDDATHTVMSRHPGYRGEHNIIMVLPALDNAQEGIHHETALNACAVVAGDRWNGFFCEQRTGSRVLTPRDEVLKGKEYYFRASDDAEVSSRPYFRTLALSTRKPAIKLVAIQNTQHATCGALPRQGSLTDTLLARDISCRLTATIEGTEHAHLIPRTEVDWFRQSTMFQYGVAPRPEIEPIDVPRNALLFRSDIHTVFDQRRFAITLKPLLPASDSAATHGLAVHLFSLGLSEQFAKLYHGVALQPLHGVAPEYLFARFAWTVFAYSVQFLQQDIKRALYIARDGETSEQEVNRDQCMQLYLTHKCRSLRPFKRKRDDRCPAREGDCDTEEQQDEDEDRHKGRARLRSTTFLATSKATPPAELLAEDVNLAYEHIYSPLQDRRSVP